MNWWLLAIKKYADLNGRARRKEFWMFSLFQLIFLIVAFILDIVLGTEIQNLRYGIIYVLYLTATALPSLGVSVRRLHDIGYSGWWFLINAIPYVGPFILLIFLAKDSQPGKNKYGANPKLGT